MERLLRITNALLGIIALCLILLVASIYRVDAVAEAHAQQPIQPSNYGIGDAQPVYLVYTDGKNLRWPVVGLDGAVPTKPAPQ